MKLARCRQLSRRPLTGTWYRAVRPQHLVTALAFAQTATIPGRYNAGNTHRPGFQVLYLAEDQLVALFEVQALFGSPLAGQSYTPNPAPGQHWAVIQVHVVLHAVADLTAAGERQLAGTTVQELTGDWRGYALRNPNAALDPPYWTNVPTQKLGAALRAVRGLEGFITYSARLPTRKCLVVFPDRLRKRSMLRFVGPDGSDMATIP